MTIFNRILKGYACANLFFPDIAPFHPVTLPCQSDNVSFQSCNLSIYPDTHISCSRSLPSYHAGQHSWTGTSPFRAQSRHF